MSQKGHYFVRSFILLGFSVLLGKLLLTGEIQYYLAPRMQGLCYVTLGILVILTFASLIQGISNSSQYDCECGEVHTLPNGFVKNAVIYSLFVLPLLMGFMLPNKLLGSAAADMKGVNLLTGNAKQLMASRPAKSASPENQSEAGSEAQPEDQPAEQHRSSTGASLPTSQAAPAKKMADKPLSDVELRKKFDIGFGDYYRDIAVALYKQPVIKIDEHNFMDAMTILDLFADEFDGRKLETVGFVYRQPDFTATEFVAARFTVSCCTADASVTGILIQSPQAKKFANDSWVKVKGTLKITSLDGNEFLQLEADDITPVKAPKTAYVYFNNTSGN